MGFKAIGTTIGVVIIIDPDVRHPISQEIVIDDTVIRLGRLRVEDVHELGLLEGGPTLFVFPYF